MPAKGKASREDYLKNRAYYIARETSAAGKHKRVERDQARTAAIKAGRLSGAHDPRTVDHVTPLSKGGGNAGSNIKIMSGTANRKKFNH